MGKASRTKRQSAQEKIAAQREAQRRAERQRQLLITGTSMVVVAALVVAFVAVKLLGGGGGNAAGNTIRGRAAAAVVNAIARVPASTLNTIGAGTGQTNKPKPIPGTPLTQNGKPEVLYMGAEYCPYCAAERWALTLALSRFGTFSGIGLIHSSSSDAFPSTPTLTYYRSGYTSKYLAFTPVEMQTVDRKTLQTPTAAQNALLAKYDRAPYTQTAGSIPFIDIGNKFGVIGGSSFLPSGLKGLTWSQVAAGMSSPTSPVAKQVDGAANHLIAAFCKVTSNRPANVCTSPAIKTLQGTL